MVIWWAKEASQSPTWGLGGWELFREFFFLTTKLNCLKCRLLQEKKVKYQYIDRYPGISILGLVGI